MINRHILHIVLIAFFFCTCTAENSTISTVGNELPPPLVPFQHEQLRPISEVLGVTHVSGRYYFTDKPFMKEGADVINSLGSKVIKLWFTKDMKSSYSYNSSWPVTMKSLTDLAQTPYMTELFTMPFKTYVLEATEFASTKWKDGVTAEEAKKVSDEFYDVSKYLLQTYKNTGKTFILQNWEGDNALVPGNMNEAEIPIAIQGMIDWLNARQDGVNRARKEVGMNGVVVANCVEMNKVLLPVPEDNLVVDVVVPYTNADLYSLSSWGTRMPGDESKLPAKLNYIASKAPASELYGEKNVMLGEFGQYERSCLNGDSDFSDEGSGARQLTSVKNQLEYALEWGVVYALYWEVYCNGTVQGATPQPDGTYLNKDLKGVWLIRANGTKTPVYNYFEDILQTNANIKTQVPNTDIYTNR